VCMNSEPEGRASWDSSKDFEVRTSFTNVQMFKRSDI
jgi:hypothetical protein